MGLLDDGDEVGFAVSVRDGFEVGIPVHDILSKTRQRKNNDKRDGVVDGVCVGEKVLTVIAVTPAQFTHSH